MIFRFLIFECPFSEQKIRLSLLVTIHIYKKYINKFVQHCVRVFIYNVKTNFKMNCNCCNILQDLLKAIRI